MPITWIQGTTTQASEGGPGIPISLTITGVGSGNCLIVSIGQRKNTDTGQGLMYLTSSPGDIWLAPICSPSQIISGGVADFQLLTFVAVNCAGGDTTITFHESEHYGAYAIAIDEYSGVLAANPIDQVSYQSTLYSSGLSSVISGPITAASGQLVYSAAFAAANPDTLTPTVGFTQRETVSGSLAYPVTLTTWDQQSTGASYSNTVTSSSVPSTLHVVIIGLSPTTITRPLVQVAATALAVITSNSVSVSFPYPNTAGNLLIAVANIYEVTNAVITDTAGNIWNTVYSSPSGGTDTIVMAYALNCNVGANRVTLTAPGGGTDDVFNLIVAEYNFHGTYVSSSKGVVTNASTVSTGDVIVSQTPGFLVSMFDWGSSTGLVSPSPASQLGTLRYQFDFSGLFMESVRGVGLADQTENTAGSYQNTFDISPLSGADMGAAILGFAGIPPPPPIKLKPHIFAVVYPAPPQTSQIKHLVYDIHGEAWYADKFADAEHIMHYTVPQHDPTAETFVLAGDGGGHVLVETANHDDNGSPIACNVTTRESNPGGWAYAWFENPGVDLLPTLNVPMTVQAASLNALVGVPTTVPASLTRVTQQIVDIGGGQPLKSLGLQFLWSQTYAAGEFNPVTLYMMQWLAVAYPEPILNQRTKGTSHGLRGFQHLYMGQLAYVAPNAPVTITLNFDQPGGAGNTATILLPATTVPHSPDPIKQNFKIPPNKWKITSYDIASTAPFFLWPEDCEMWLREWGAEGQYAVVRPWGGAEGGTIA